MDSLRSSMKNLPNLPQSTSLPVHRGVYQSTESTESTRSLPGGWWTRDPSGFFFGGSDGSLQPQLLQKWTKAKSRLALLPIVGTVRCLRSLHRPRHRPNGTGLSSAITTAPLVAAPSTRAPDDLAPQHCAVCATSAKHSGAAASHSSPLPTPAARFVHSTRYVECTYQAAEVMRRRVGNRRKLQVMTFCAS